MKFSSPFQQEPPDRKGETPRINGEMPSQERMNSSSPKSLLENPLYRRTSVNTARPIERIDLARSEFELLTDPENVTHSSGSEDDCSERRPQHQRSEDEHDATVLRRFEKALKEGRLTRTDEIERAQQRCFEISDSHDDREDKIGAWAIRLYETFEMILNERRDRATCLPDGPDEPEPLVRATSVSAALKAKFGTPS